VWVWKCGNRPLLDTPWAARAAAAPVPSAVAGVVGGRQTTAVPTVRLGRCGRLVPVDCQRSRNSPVVGFDAHVIPHPLT